MTGLITIEEAIELLETPSSNLTPAGKLQMIFDLLYPPMEVVIENP